MPKRTIVAVSGGFDPVHPGHIELIMRAKLLKPEVELVVILNNDNWLMKKKGFVFMRENDRLQIMYALKGVDRVILTSHRVNDPDMSVCRELRELKPNIFANGGDRHEGNTPEDEVCWDLGIREAYNLGPKINSSSDLVLEVHEKLKQREMEGHLV